MDQVWIDIEDNPNCGYFPMQTFEAQGTPQIAKSVVIDEVSGRDGPQEVVGWSAESGGSPSEVTVVLIGDSGAGMSRLVMGGDNGIRMRPAKSASEWSLDDAEQRGEPYILLGVDVPHTLCE
jgi:hypothetical protein